MNYHIIYITIIIICLIAVIFYRNKYLRYKTSYMRVIDERNTYRTKLTAIKEMCFNGTPGKRG